MTVLFVWIYMLFVTKFRNAKENIVVAIENEHLQTLWTPLLASNSLNRAHYLGLHT